MDLDEAYRILEVAPGASEEAVREARKTLAKVWHPDRHANDPALQKKAQDKLADVNAAFEAVESAGFPTQPPRRATPMPGAPPAAATPPVAPPAPPTRVAPPPPEKANIEFVPHRRVRWSVILVLAAALGLGAYLAITKLGSSKQVTPPVDAAVVMPAPDATVTIPPDATVSDPVDADVVVVADAAEPPVADGGVVVRREKTFTIGSSQADVIAAQGQPNGTSRSTSIVNGAKTTSLKLTWGESSTVDFDGDDRVIGWSEGDSPLHVRLDVHDPKQADAAKARGTIKVGSGRDEVLGLLGPPSAIAGTWWSYGTSRLELEYGKVIRIVQGEPELPVAR